ncbi:MAG: four-carbon acid sugar kinase family protein [Pirellulaceae bacterium]
MNRSLKETLASLPPELASSQLPEIRKLLAATNRKIIVLDDDPTGTQTVYDTPVLTTWSTDAIAQELDGDHQLIYILTNSRSLPSEAAEKLAREIGNNLAKVSASKQQPLSVISRSDSTLRGHYPIEVDALADSLGRADAPQVIMPFFLQGGRLTIDDVHYVADGDDLVPASETPFAKDAAFGFHNANLIDWVIEKRGGQIRRDQITSISLGELRSGDTESLTARLTAMPANQVCVVNAVTMRDVESFVVAALHAENYGSQFVYRTAASFVQAYAGLEPKPVLDSDEMVNPSAKSGLIAVGSYVPKTTAQLKHLIENAENLVAVELSVNEILGDQSDAHLADAIAATSRHLQAGHNVVLHTSRDLVTGDNANSSLEIGNRVSAALVQVVRSIDAPLRFLIAKGGITSSDIATRGLEAKRAIVLGQILPGVPVWQTQQESRRPGLAYVVFPGNVGGDDALLQAYQKLQ